MHTSTIPTLTAFLSLLLHLTDASILDISGMPNRLLLPRQSSTNLQSFTQSLGGIPASPITRSGDSGRPFSVEGSTFPDFASAAQRSCDRQFDGCQREANSGGGGAGFSVNDCDQQKNACNSAQQAATVQSFDAAPGQGNGGGNQGRTENIGPDPLFPDFDLICDVDPDPESDTEAPQVIGQALPRPATPSEAAPNASSQPAALNGTTFAPTANAPAPAEEEEEQESEGPEEREDDGSDDGRSGKSQDEGSGDRKDGKDGKEKGKGEGKDEGEGRGKGAGDEKRARGIRGRSKI